MGYSFRYISSLNQYNSIIKKNKLIPSIPAVNEMNEEGGIDCELIIRYHHEWTKIKFKNERNEAHAGMEWII